MSTTTDYPFETLQTKTLAGFKTLAGSSKLNIIRNPNNSKLFFSCGDISGAVSKNFKSSKGDITLCEVYPKELANPSNSDIFWILCNKPESTDNVEETL